MIALYARPKFCQRRMWGKQKADSPTAWKIPLTGVSAQSVGLAACTCDRTVTRNATVTLRLEVRMRAKGGILKILFLTSTWEVCKFYLCNRNKLYTSLEHAVSQKSLSCCLSNSSKLHFTDF